MPRIAPNRMTAASLRYVTMLDWKIVPTESTATMLPTMYATIRAVISLRIP
jgi:hypothetical protein